MRAAILGAGGIGLALAHFLLKKGADVMLSAPSLKTFAGETQVVTATGIDEGRAPVSVAVSAARAVDGADIVFICSPAWSHAGLIDEIAEHLRPGSTAIISAQYSLGALRLASRARAHAIDVRVAAWSTTAATARRSAPLQVRIMTQRPKIDVAAVDPADTAPVTRLCADLLGERFNATTMACIALANVNPIAHAPNALCNITRIERGERWRNYEMMTPGVCAVIEALDRERLAVANRIGLTLPSLTQHINTSFGVPEGTLADMCAHILATRGGPDGPSELGTRYVTEDVPFGIMPVIAMGRAAGLDMATHVAVAAVLSTFYGRDFRRENTLLDLAGVEALDTQGLRALLRVDTAGF